MQTGANYIVRPCLVTLLILFDEEYFIVQNKPVMPTLNILFPLVLKYC